MLSTFRFASVSTWLTSTNLWQLRLCLRGGKARQTLGARLRRYAGSLKAFSYMIIRHADVLSEAPPLRQTAQATTAIKPHIPEVYV